MCQLQVSLLYLTFLSIQLSSPGSVRAKVRARPACEADIRNCPSESCWLEAITHTRPEIVVTITPGVGLLSRNIQNME